MRNYKYIFLGLLASIMFVSCEDEDFTGDSSLEPSSPTVTLSGFESSYVFTEQDSTITITATLDVTQIVDIPIYIYQSAGDAIEGAEGDFVIDATNSRIVIPANRLSASATITVMADDVIESTEVFTLTIGDDRTTNASINPTSIDFTIGNVTSPEIEFNLTWGVTDTYAPDGTIYGPDEVADLIFGVYDDAGTLIEEFDGTGFETFSGMDGYTDGTYGLTVSIYGVVDLGEGQTLPSADISLSYFQSGVQTETITLPGIMDLNNVCDANIVHIADVVKSGSSYTVTEVGLLPTPEASDFEGNLIGQDGNLDGIAFVGESIIVSSINANGNLELDSINVDFMEAVWAETVLVTSPVELTVDYDEKTIVIEEQYIFTTLYNGAEYEYTIYGTGYIDACNNIILEYEMNQGGFLVGGWLNANGYMTDELFVAIVSL